MADPYLVQAAKDYNIPLGVLEGIAVTEAQDWATIAPGEGSVGRLQVNPVHAAEVQQQMGVSWQEFVRRPDLQIKFWVPKLAAAWNQAKAQGATDEQAAWHVVKNVQAPIESRQPVQVQSILQNLGAQGGGATMTNGQTATTNKALQTLIDNITKGWAGSELERTNADWLFGNLSADLQALVMGTGGDTQGLEARRVGVEEARLGFDMEKWIADAEKDVQDRGWYVAATNFANKITQAQEGRATAEFAQQYERQFAPEGMTTLPYTGEQSAAATYMKARGLPYEPKPAVELPTTNLPRDPWALLQMAGQAVPQAPELSYTPPALPTGMGAGAQGGEVPAYAPPPTTGYGGQSVDVTAGAAMQPGAGYAPMTLDVQILQEALRRVFGRGSLLGGPPMTRIGR